MYVDPAVLGHADNGGTRLFNIRNIIVLQKPTATKTNWDNSIEEFDTGTIVISGGTVWEVMPGDPNVAPKIGIGQNIELNPGTTLYPNPKDITYNPFDIVDINNDGYADKYPSFKSSDYPNIPLPSGTYESHDGYQPYLINGQQATLNTFIYQTPSLYQIPSSDDGYEIPNVRFNLKYNHPILADNRLINIMCNPANASESIVLNAEFNDLRSVDDRVGRPLPDIGSLSPDRKSGTGAIGQLAEALSNLRNNVTEDTAQQFQNNATNILNNLSNDAKDYYINAISAIIDRFRSTVIIDPNIQFVNYIIKVNVQLFDKSGTQLVVNVTPDLGSKVADLLTSTVTLGEVTKFVYDGYGTFNADITSKLPGNGQLQVSVNGETFAKTTNRDKNTVPSIIEDNVIDYEFIDYTESVGRRWAPDLGESAGGEHTLVRRDEVDISDDKGRT
jgi:hypothetical protein